MPPKPRSPIASKPPSVPAGDSAAFVVLGMHRSGTSALAKLLHAAGADVGERVLPASTGNELGHWEDAFAVETNERLLTALGRRWDDIRPLPRGWQDSEAAVEARPRIVEYIRGSRLRHRAWAIKDPRMCLLAELWLGAMAEAGCRPAVLLLVRHPQEVADSLAARDGMGFPRANLLWARHMLEAEHASRELPRIALTYAQLLDDPARVLARVRALPGGTALEPAPEAGAVQTTARHHNSRNAALPAPIGGIWETFRQASESGGIAQDRMDGFAAALAEADGLYAPMFADLAREQDTLWARTARAEAALADKSLAAPPGAAEIAGLEDALAAGIGQVVASISVDLVHMQDEHAKAVSTASELSAQAGLARQISPSLDQLREGISTLSKNMVDAVSIELRRMQDEHARAVSSASELSAQIGMAREISPSLDQLREGVSDLSTRMVDAVNVELRRMQDEHAKAITAAAGSSAEAALAREISPSLDQLREGVATLSTNMVDAVNVDLRRMQDEHAKAITAAAGLSAEAALAREISPSLDQVREGVSALSTRMVDAVNIELRRMQDEHAKAITVAAGLAAQAALARDLVPQMAQLRSGLEAAMSEQRQASAEEARHLRELAMALQEQLQQRDAALSGMQEQLQQRDAAHAGLQEQLRQRDAEFALLRHQAGVLQEDSDLLQQLRESRSWRMTRPLRLASRLLAGNATQDDRDRIRRWWALQLAATAFLPRGFRERKWREGRGAIRVTADVAAGTAAASVAPAEPVDVLPMAGRPDVFVWAVIDWHFRTQRPQHLARGLVEAGHRVFYISNNLVDDPGPGFNIEALDASRRLFQVFLNVDGAPAIYYGSPTAQVVAQLRRSVGELMQWADSDGGLCIVQHPFWSEVASAVPGSALLYDCMDHHAGFEDNAPDVLAAEAALIRAADLLVVTSDWLDRELAAENPNRVLIRNAGDFGHFCEVPEQRYRDRQGRRIIGYYGAIAEWFDVELVRAVARAHPECLVLLVGSDTAEVAAQLAGESNVLFTGEVPYDRLPFYLHAFDVTLLPFKVIPLTLATNPVKVYEYLSAGKPVVSIDLPEIRQFGSLVYCAGGSSEFVEAVGEALGEESPELVSRRMAFASEQTWVHRAEELDNAIAALPEPMVSVIVLTYNNLEFTRACLHSLVAESNWRNLEIIVVDNASTDGSREFLGEWEAQGPGRRVILNDANLGFSAGNNVGLAAASGDYLILLNNDTYVTPNWVRTMVNHLARDPGIGILGPVTNNIGNEARIEVHYADMDGMKRAAAAWTRRHAGKLFDIPTVAFFCVAMPRSTYERVGSLDEAFGIGFFEDDDYCRRLQAAGLRVACAEDVFVHHHLSASFDALKAERKQELFERNKAIYEAKWGEWTPHAYREREQ